MERHAEGNDLQWKQRDAHQTYVTPSNGRDLQASKLLQLGNISKAAQGTLEHQQPNNPLSQTPTQGPHHIPRPKANYA